MNDRYKVLLVDDSESDRATYRRYLLADENFDYQIIEAESLEEGLELWRSEAPGLILVDVNLSDGSGLKLLAEIKKNTPQKNISVIVMTGQEDERIKVQAMKLGASDYLVKDDITPSILCYYVRSAIAEQNFTEKLTQLEEQLQQKVPPLTYGHLQKIAEILPSVIFVMVLSSKGSSHFEYISEAAEKLHEITQAEILANADLVYEQIHPDDVENYCQAIEVSLSQISLFEHKWRIITPSGKLKWIKSKAEIELRENGDFAWCGIVEDISEQQFEIEQRQQSEYTKSIILKTIPDILIQMDRQGKFIPISGGNNVRDLSAGIPHSELNIYDILPQYLIEERLELAHLAIETGQVQIYEQIIEFGDEQQYEEIRIAALNEQEVLLIIRDISDRKQVEQENLRLKERLQFILASSSAIIYSCKPYEPYEITFMSANIETILGYKAEDFMAQDNFWANHLHPEDVPRVFSDLSVFFEIGTHTYEYRILHKKGYYLWLRDQLRLLRDEQGNPLEIIGSCFDISDRKQAEAEGKEFNRRWRSALDKIQMIVIQLDLDGNVQYINPFFLKISGFSPEEVINKHWITHFVSSEHQLSLETVFQEILEEINNEYYVNSILTKSGEERIISWHNSVLKDKQGQSMGVISIGEDITEKHRLEQIKSEFLSIVSHELKTPLTTIQASLSLLSEKIIDPASEDGEMIITLATDGVDRLVRLVNDIFDAERLQSGKFHIKKSDCHTQKIMTDAIAQVQELAKQANIKIHLSPNSYSLHADSDRLVQVLINLLGNAIKFSPPSSTIDVSVEQQTSYLLFTVRDRGRGIPSHKLEIIFERFKQIDSSDVREKEGAGLGLAISKEIVEQHGGKIWVESSVGKGSNFYFTVAHLKDY